MVTLYWSLSASGSALSPPLAQELPLFEVRARELQHLADQRGSCGPLGSTHSKLLRGSRSATRREAGSERLAPSCHTGARASSESVKCNRVQIANSLGASTRRVRCRARVGRKSKVRQIFDIIEEKSQGKLRRFT